MGRRWQRISGGARIEHTKCQSCNRETPYLFKGYAWREFRLDPIRTRHTRMFGIIQRLVQAMVCQRCFEANQPEPKPIPLLCYPETSYLWENL